MWQNTTDLACVREPRDLDRLPADGRTEFVALWADVAAVIALAK